MAAFKTGDIVELRSGGPKMTVYDEEFSGDIRCQWFVNAKLQEGTFPPGSLREPEGTPE